MESLTSKYVCRLLGIKYWQLDYIIKSGKLKEPMRTTSGQRIFSQEDIEELQKIITKNKKDACK